MSSRIACVVAWGLWLIGGPGIAARAADPPGLRDEVSLIRALRPAGKAPVVPSRSQVYRALESMGPPGPWMPRSSQERELGPSRAVYAKVAPAIVVVRSEDGHGTGFVIDADGWILTNHHVIAEAVPDGANGAKRVNVHVGRMRDGFMQIIDQGLPAHVYKESEDKDLALLKLAEAPPAEVGPLAVIGLAGQAPAVGDDCVAIGHPRASMLWTARSGEVSGVGQWPQDRIDVVMQRLASSEKEKQELSLALKSIKSRKVLISSCGLNPGDSGGPLLDVKGELIAVSFAIPAAAEGERIRVDKFSYHVHLDEVKDFLKGPRPTRPLAYAPDPWPPATSGDRLDLDKDDVPETLIFSADRELAPTGLLFDLDQDSSDKFGARAPDEIVEQKAWDFELALHFQPTPRAFYDTDDDGKIDLVLTASPSPDDGRVSVQRLENGEWVKGKPREGRIVDLALIKSEESRSRLIKILRAISK